MNATIIALALAASPTDWAHPTFDVSDVEVQARGPSSHMTTFDADGEVSAEIVVQLDESGQPRIDVVFADGLHLSIVDGKVETDNEAEVAERADAIERWLAANDPQADWIPCAIATAETIRHGVTASPWVLVSSYVAACTCLPLLVEEWEDYSCPGF
jgi:hypothetical protein